VEGLDLSPLTGLGIGSGWAIVCLLVIMLFRGTLVTRREVDAKDRYIEALTQALSTKDEQLTLVLKETAPTLTTFLEDVRDAARLVRSGDHPPEGGS
jgi:ABC-type transporter Mla subunit MlaD